MEVEIEDKLQEIYRNLIVEVNYKEIRKYEILIKLENKGGKFEYLYDAHLTFDANINIIVSKIDRIILSYYKRGE